MRGYEGQDLSRPPTAAHGAGLWAQGVSRLVGDRHPFRLSFFSKAARSQGLFGTQRKGDAVPSWLQTVMLDGRTAAWLQVAGGRTNVSSSEIRGERRMGQGGIQGFEVCSREAGSRNSSYTDRPPLESRRGQVETAGTERHSDCVLGASWVQPPSLEHSFPLTGAAVAPATSPTCWPPASTSSGPLQRRKSSKWTNCWLCPRRAMPSVHGDHHGCWRSAISGCRGCRRDDAGASGQAAHQGQGRPPSRGPLQALLFLLLRLQPAPV